MQTQPSTVAICQNHPNMPARFQCERCGGLFCKNCVHLKEVAGAKIIVCPKCKDVCRPLRLPGKKSPAKSSSFFAKLADAFIYPLRGHGVFLFLGYIALILLLQLSAFVPAFGMFGVFSLIARIGVFGYITAFLFSVIASSANGENHLPDWPDVTNWWDDIFCPALLMIGTYLFCFGLPIAYTIYCAFQNTDYSPYPLWILMGIGAFYLPMALLAVVLSDSLAGLNPLLVLSSIGKIFPAYFAILVMIAIVVGLIVLTSFIPVLGYILALYAQLVIMRLLGIIYHQNHKKLDWFKT